MNDFYTSKEECLKAEKKYQNTNPRYRNFNQKYYTAGDEEQFFNARNYTNDEEKEKHTYIKKSNFQFDIPFCYENISADAVTHTFKYMFHKFKKGIYIRIKENKVISFIPFSKSKFINEWSQNIKINPKFYNFQEFIKYIYDMENRKFNERKINKFSDEWYANNCLLRFEFPISEGDTGYPHLKNMFEELCQNRQVPDIELFLNRRDFPVLKKDKTEPYHHIFDSENVPLVSYAFEKYAPILSSVSNATFADLSIPTIEDWARVKSFEGCFFEKTQQCCFQGNFNMPWDERKPIAVFRGASTGFGTTIENNPRLKVAYLSSQKRKDSDDLYFLDAGITDWNLRPRKIMGEPYLQTIDIQKLSFSLSPKLTPEEQSTYKYIIHICGHVSAFRLSLELSMGSVILLVESDYKLWFEQLLVPYVHYIPVKKDLSDIYEKISWCKKNDLESMKIATNAKEFYDCFLSKKGIFDYLQDLLFSLKCKMGHYKYNTVLSLFREKEEKWVLENKLLHGFQKDKLLLSTKNTEIYSVKNEKSKILKKGKNELREIFIYFNGVKDIEHFSQVYGCSIEKDIISEKYDGITFYDYLKTEYNLQDYLKILISLSFALYQAQNKCGFVHCDLFPWNIILIKQSKPKICTYNIDGMEYQMQVNYFPIIIDYEKSHIIFENMHYGYIHKFEMNSIFDMLCLIFSSLALIMKEHAQLHKKDEYMIMKLVNFFAESELFSKKFAYFPTMRHFVCAHSSFSVLSALEHKQIKSKRILDFIFFFKDQNMFTSKKVFSLHASYRVKNNDYSFKFKNKLFVYLLFQQLNDKKLFQQFKFYLENTENKFSSFEYKTSLDDEIMYNRENVQKTICDLEKMNVDKFILKEKEIAFEILSYQGLFEVEENDRQVFQNTYCKISTFDILHYFSDLDTLKFISNYI
jgi:hypothetical protein